MKPIILFYSLTGKTRIIAKSAAEELQCDIQEVKETKKRSLLGACFLGLFEAIRGRGSEIEPLNADFADKDLIIIATPIWASNPVPAVNTLISKLNLKGKNVVILISLSSGDDSRPAAILTDRINKKGGRVLTHHGFKTGMVSEDELINQVKETVKLYK